MTKKFLALTAVMMLCTAVRAEGEKLKALIVDGQNNHGVWPKTTQMMKRYLENTQRFSVDIATTAKRGSDPDFKPTFAEYNVVVSNYNGAAWPEDGDPLPGPDLQVDLFQDWLGRFVGEPHLLEAQRPQ